MIEEVLVTARYNPTVDPSLGIWHWEVPVYLFLGGLTAGIMFFAATMILMKKDDVADYTANRMALWAPIVISVGMGALFLDLSHKLYVWRFYTAFMPASPMSWGAWILIFIYPISILQVLSTLRRGYPTLAGWVEKVPLGGGILDFSERNRAAIAKWTIPFAVALGIYTGILLSAFSARPFWNTGILGPLFLISGLSTAAALSVIMGRSHQEKLLFTRIDLGLILVEIVLIALLVINLTTAAGVQLNAAEYILGGEYTVMFWGLFFTIGLLVPLVQEYGELKGMRTLAFLGPWLVLFGGYMLRHVTVELGQHTTWTEYATQFDPALLQRLMMQ